MSNQAVTLTATQQRFMDALTDEDAFGRVAVGNGRELRLDTARALQRKGLIVLTSYRSTHTGRVTHDYQATLPV
jgi:hypothetical protein